MPHRDGYQNAVDLAISLCLTYTLCISIVRLWIRKGTYGQDDVVIAAATIVSLANTAAEYVALSSGLGTRWTSLMANDSLGALNKASLAGVITFIAALYLSKCAMLTFLSRITKTSSEVRIYWIFNAVMASIGVVSIFVATVGCSYSSGYYWAFHANLESCPSLATRWQVITGLDVTTEVFLLALPVQLVWGLHMRMRRKAMILMAFWLRLPILGFSLGRNYYTIHLRLPDQDQGLTSAIVVIWMQVELGYALAASTLSALKAFTETFNSGFGLGFTRGKDDNEYALSGVSSRSRSRGATASDKSKTLSPINTKRSDFQTGSSRSPRLKPGVNISTKSISPVGDAFDGPGLKLRPDESNSFTSVTAEPSGPEHWRNYTSPTSDGHSSSDEMVIVRHTEYEVQHDEAPMLPLQSHTHM